MRADRFSKKGRKSLLIINGGSPCLLRFQKKEGRKILCRKRRGKKEGGFTARELYVIRKKRNSGNWIIPKREEGGGERREVKEFILIMSKRGVFIELFFRGGGEMEGRYVSREGEKKEGGEGKKESQLNKEEHEEKR